MRCWTRQCHLTRRIECPAFCPQHLDNVQSGHDASVVRLREQRAKYRALEERRVAEDNATREARMEGVKSMYDRRDMARALERESNRPGGAREREVRGVI